MTDYSRSNDFVIGADTQNLQQEGVSFLDSVGQALQYGVGASLTSGILGITNTIKSAANMFGADIPLSDETSAVQYVFGSDAANYYQDHKTGADLAGLLVGGVGIGSAAIKGVHALQAGGIASEALSTATGMRNADIVLGSKAVQAAAMQVKSDAYAYSLNFTTRLNAYAAGMKQQVIENSAVTAALLLTQNQDALLNPDGKDYLSAIGSQAVEFAPFVAAGAVLGTGIEALKINGYLKAQFQAGKVANAFKEYALNDYIAAMPAGDKLVLSLQNQAARKADPALMQTGDNAGDAAIAIGNQKIDTAIGNLTLDLTPATGDPLITGAVVKKIASLDPEAQVSALTGATSVHTIDAGLDADLFKFMQKTVGPKAVFETGTANTIEDQMSAFLKIAAKGISQNREGWTLKLAPDLFKSTLQKASITSSRVSPPSAIGVPREIPVGSLPGTASSAFSRAVEPAIKKAIANGNYVTHVTPDGQNIKFVAAVHSSIPNNAAVYAVHDGKIVGELSYSKGRLANGQAENPLVHVVSGYRRKGIASAMYSIAEDNGGAIPALNQQGQIRSGDGQAFRTALEKKAGPLRRTGGTVAPNTVFRYYKGKIQPGNLSTVDLGGLVQVDLGGIEDLHAAMKDTLGAINPMAAKMSLDDFKEYVTMHEISHYKNVSNTHLIKAVERATSRGSKLFNELEQISRRVSPESWNALDAKMASLAEQQGKTVDEIVDISRKGTKAAKGVKAAPSVWQSEEATNAANLVTHAATLLANPKFAEQIAREYPTVARLMKTHGMIAMPFSPTRAYFNLRTGAMATSVLPLAQDLGKIVVEGNRVGIKGTGNFWKYDQNLHAADLPERITAVDFERGNATRDLLLQAQAQFGAMAQTDVKTFMKAPGEFHAKENDFAALERLATAQDSVFKEPHVVKVYTRDGKEAFVGDQAMLRDYLIQKKQEMHVALQQKGMNEQFISHVLNTGEKFMLNPLNTTDALMMGVRDYTKPENVAMKYTRMNPESVDGSVRSMDVLNWRRAEFEHRAQMVSAGILGDTFEKLPEIKREDLFGLVPGKGYASLFKAAYAEFGSPREKALAVNRLVHKEIDARGIDIEQDMRPYYDHFDSKDAFLDRKQLAYIDNLARRKNLYIERDANGVRYVVDQEAKAKYLEDMVKQLEEKNPFVTTETAKTKIADARKVYDTQLQAVANNEWTKNLQFMKDPNKQEVIELTKAVGNFYEFTHIPKNAEFIARDQAIADANGRAVFRDARRIYAPPLNLRETPYYAFVVPEEAVSDVVGRSKYMIYGATSDELRQKMQYIQQHHGGRYKVVTDSPGDLQLYKKLQGEYDRNLVLNEWDFDSNLHRTGTAQDFLVSPDLKGSATLDRYRNYYHKKTQYHIRSAVELKYAALNEDLKQADQVYDAANRSKLGARTDQVTPFAEFRNLLLDINSFDGELQGNWKRVNSFVSEKGSAFLSAASRVLTNDSVKLSQAEYDAIISKAESMGLTTPIKDVTRAIAASPEITDKRMLDSLVRTMNMFVATFQLPLDVLNSLLQIISIPVLASSAVRDARAALNGTSSGAALHSALHVRNPASGMQEPTFMKLMSRAMGDFFDPKYKAFHDELRSRNILLDETRQYLEAADFSGFTGRHALGVVQNKLDTLRMQVGKVTLHRFAEDFGRALVAHVFRQIAEFRGMGKDEMYSLISNAVDQVHGTYRRNARAQVFNGVIGQAVGLYQTYMFNLFQTMTRHLENRNLATLATMAGMQSAIFGIRSMPGFTTLNSMIANTNSGHVDLYNLMGADNGDATLAEYLMYGAASHMFAFPVDVFSRGDIAIRNTTVLPTDLKDIPAISQIGKFVTNIWTTLGNVAASAGAGDAQGVYNAALQGVAHNGLSRPIQGLATVLAGNLTTQQGTPLFQNVNYNGYDPALGFNYAAMFARVIGGKPTREAVLLDNYYRQVAYKSSTQADIAAIGEQIKLASPASVEKRYAEFASAYERAGGNPENFNAYFSKQIAAADQSAVEEFRNKLKGDTAFGRTYQRMLQTRSLQPVWTLDPNSAASE